MVLKKDLQTFYSSGPEKDQLEASAVVLQLLLFGIDRLWWRLRLGWWLLIFLLCSKWGLLMFLLCSKWWLEDRRLVVACQLVKKAVVYQSDGRSSQTKDLKVLICCVNFFRL